jgi:hypothetical protein
MGILEDLMKALDRIPIWKRLNEVPSEVGDLKQRVAELETKLEGKWPADVCRFCGERAARLDYMIPANEKGIYREDWLCEKCQKEDRRSYKVATKT